MRGATVAAMALLAGALPAAAEGCRLALSLALDYTDFEAAMRRKLVREVGAGVFSLRQ